MKVEPNNRIATDPSGQALRNISDTALWVAALRALESEEPGTPFKNFQFI